MNDVARSNLIGNADNAIHSIRIPRGAQITCTADLKLQFDGATLSETPTTSPISLKNQFAQRRVWGVPCRHNGTPYCEFVDLFDGCYLPPHMGGDGTSATDKYCKYGYALILVNTPFQLYNDPASDSMTNKAWDEYQQTPGFAYNTNAINTQSLGAYDRNFLRTTPNKGSYATGSRTYAIFMASESKMMNFVGGQDVMMSGNFWRYTSYIPYFWRKFCSSETWTFTPAGIPYPNPTGSNYIHIAPQAGKIGTLDVPFTVTQRAVNLAGLSTPNPAAATCFNTKTINTKLVFDGSPVLTEIPT